MESFGMKPFVSYIPIIHSPELVVPNFKGMRKVQYLGVTGWRGKPDIMSS